MPGETVPSLSAETAVQYGFNVGLPRLRDIFTRAGVKVTFGTTGNAAERHPEIIRELADLGHEIAAHGYSEGTPPVFQTREEQKAGIEKTLAALESVTGKRPRGWWSPGALCNEDTIDLLAEQGLLYHGDLQDDELPYFIDIKGRTIVEMPYNMVGNINDYRIFINHRRSVEENLAYLISTFEAYFAQAKETPMMMIVGTHPFVSGRAEAAAVLSQFLDHLISRSELWITTYGEAAEWWFRTHGETKNS
jgi:peptidoglycan/xylan/chitin deacetylase (PgdA/CDA1 family)